jgi:hypothetical protein
MFGSQLSDFLEGHMKNNLDFNGFIQAAIIVKDIEKAAKAWAELFNVPVPETRVADAGPDTGNTNVTYRGKPAAYGLRLCSIKAGNWIVELHEAGGGDSTYQEFIDKHGQGVHHLGFAVGEKRDAVIGELEDMGYEMRQTGIDATNSWTIVDSEDILGVNLNIKPHG